MYCLCETFFKKLNHNAVHSYKVVHGWGLVDSPSHPQDPHEPSPLPPHTHITPQLLLSGACELCSPVSKTLLLRFAFDLGCAYRGASSQGGVTTLPEQLP